MPRPRLQSPVPKAFPPPFLGARGPHPQSLPALQLPRPWLPLPTAPYEDRVTFSNTGITFHSVTRKDTGTYTCMVSDEGGTAYGEVSVQLTVLGMCLPGRLHGAAQGDQCLARERPELVAGVSPSPAASLPAAPPAL